MFKKITSNESLNEFYSLEEKTQIGVQLSAQISPNPTTDLVQITFNKIMSCQMVLTDLNGKILQNELINGISHNLDLTHLKPGTYLVQINSTTQRIVKL